MPNDGNAEEQYKRVPPGTPVDPNNDHVVVSCNTASFVSMADMHIGDLVYFTNPALVTALNTHLDQLNAPFGPFQYVSDAATLLKQLKKRKPQKAQQLEDCLSSFAEAYGFSADAFKTWDQVMFAKDRRDLAAHPLKLKAEDLSYLKGLVENPSSSVAPFKAAVEALLVAAKKQGLS